MSLETLEIAQARAAQLMGVSPEELADVNMQTVHHLGYVSLNGEKFAAFRVHAGPEGFIGKGGIRFADYGSEDRAKGVAQELAGEMNTKLAVRNHHGRWRGAKGLVNINPWGRTHEEKQKVASQYQALMDRAGLSQHDRDVPAGDVGTNGLAGIYAQAHAESHPEDPYKSAVITGKSPEHGGLEV
jgi:glutamate dehydrogenase/leucine dehydrogenase